VSPVAKSDKAVPTLARLCARVGCPCDRKQTFDIIRRYTMEETCEVLWQQAKGQFEKTDSWPVSASSDSLAKSRAFRQTFIAIAMNLVLKSCDKT